MLQRFTITVTTNSQKHFTTFSDGGSAPPPLCPCLRVSMAVSQRESLIIIIIIIIIRRRRRRRRRRKFI